MIKDVGFHPSTQPTRDLNYNNDRPNYWTLDKRKTIAQRHASQGFEGYFSTSARVKFSYSGLDNK